ncbi:MAG: hypothetical protein LBS22_01460 [Puniceicoccales bacterium]|nr:hypothetical protein [Puniceicoccales bacterium]
MRSNRATKFSCTRVSRPCTGVSTRFKMLRSKPSGSEGINNPSAGRSPMNPQLSEVRTATS